MIRNILFYETESGKVPVEDFLDKLNDKEYKKVSFVFNIITTHEKVDTKYLKKLKNTDDIWEIRVKIKNKQIRIFCFIDNGNLIIATNAYYKKEQKTNKKHINIAENHKKDYLKRR